MVRKKSYSCFYLVAATVAVMAAVTGAALDRNQKQAIFDLHNFCRASYGTNQISWGAILALEAQYIAEKCDLVDITVHSNADIIWYWTTDTLPEDIRRRFNPTLFQEYFSFCAEVLNWPDTASIGCGHHLCNPFFASASDRYSEPVEFFVCLLEPPRIAGVLGDDTHCVDDSTCPRDKPYCVDFSSEILVDVESPGTYCAPSPHPFILPDEEIPTIGTSELNSVSPSIGSIAGGTILTLQGEGFGDGFVVENNIFLVFSNYLLPCDIIPLHIATSSERMSCTTREVPEDAVGKPFHVIVYLSNRNHPLTCPWCIFTYSTVATPYLKQLSPLALLGGETLTLKGLFRADSFGDADDPPDDFEEDYFTRLLTGTLCDHYYGDENGQEYPVSKDERGISTVTCLPMDSRVGSRNVTAVLARQGTSFVSPDDHLFSIDNHLRPYHIQIHADIVGVAPSIGSSRGGTGLMITLSGQLSGYGPEDVKVSVGGVSCTDVTLDQQTDDVWVVGCITGPAPPPAKYYQGHRGVLREVFFDETYCNDIVANGTLASRSRSKLQVIHERFYRHHDVTPSDFGEVSAFCEIFSGFFVPPVDNLYSPNILSDGWSELYFGLDGSVDNLVKFADTQGTSGRWSDFPSQTVFLEAHQPYYFEFLATHEHSSWSAGMAAKFNANFTEYPYVGDYERQLVRISSTILKEQQTLSIWVHPQVQKLLIHINDLNYSSLVCPPLDIAVLQDGQELLTVSLTLHTRISEEEIEGVLFEHGVDDFRVHIQQISEQDFEFAFAYSRYFGIDPSDIPVLELHSDVVTFQCTEADDNMTLLAVDASITASQTLQYADSFNLTLDHAKYTPYLPLDVSADHLSEYLTGLVSYECDYTLPNTEDIWVSASYEEEEVETEEDAPRAFCGLHSKQNPRTVWDYGEVLFDRLYVCFAYRGPFPGLRVEFSLVEFDSSLEVNLGKTVRLDDSLDAWADYTCVDIMAEIQTNIYSHLSRSCDYVGCYQTILRLLKFNSNRDFWIDDFYLATERVYVYQNIFPSFPNGVDIAHITAEGGPLPQPNLIRITPTAGVYYDYTDFSNDKYVLVISQYLLEYTVRECGFDIPVIQGVYNAPTSYYESVSAERVQMGSEPVTGTFDITLEDRTHYFIPADIDEDHLKFYLKRSFPEQGDFKVYRGGTCAGYLWVLEWAERGGDMPQMVVDGSNLYGQAVTIHSHTLVNGGTLLRPLRGDMLRTPASNPQVDVMINGIPSSCRGQNCSFLHSEAITPKITSVSPTQGQGGTNVTIKGSGFSTGSRVLVEIGGAPCHLESDNDTVIVCVAARHAAGTYEVVVTVEGIGREQGSILASCFTYLLTLGTVTPQTGGISGGYRINITGEGFLKFINTPNTFFGSGGLAFLPWFHYGIGLPFIEGIQHLNLCPYLEEYFELRLDNISSCFQGVGNQGVFVSEACSICSHTDQCDDTSLHWAELILGFPSQVFLGNYPCIIVEADIDYVTCVLVLAPPGELNITVVVFDQSDTLVGPFTSLVSQTPTVEDVSPLMGAVTGGTKLTIRGTRFTLDPESKVSVNIGLSSCNVSFVNETLINCTTGPHPPVALPIIISTDFGIAISASAELLNGLVSDMELFDIFEYRLVVEVNETTFLTSGSVRGLFEVWIYGGVFVDKRTVVYVGKKPAEILSVKSDRIAILAPSSASTKDVYLNIIPIGDDGDFDFQWSESFFAISVGDTVVWNWDVTAGLNILVRIKGDAFTVTKTFCDVYGHCSFTFNETGTYYVTTEVILLLKLERVVLDELIFVDKIPLSFEPITVFVGGYLAHVDPGFYNQNYSKTTTSNSTTSDSSSMEPQRKRRLVHVIETGDYFDLSNCDNNQPHVFFPSLFVRYSPCHTPIAFNVLPAQGSRLSTEFTIQGEGFGSGTVENQVQFGGLTCNILFSSHFETVCTFNNTGAEETSLPYAFVPLPLQLLVFEDNRGSAYIFQQYNTNVTLLPVIFSITPLAGSVEGGTDVVITGDSLLFSYDDENLGKWINLGDIPCVIAERNYSVVTCTTLQADSGQVFNISFHFLDKPLETICSSDDGCAYTFSEDFTPEVTSVSPITIGGADYNDTNTLVLSGSGFSDVSQDNIVRVGNFLCVTFDATQERIFCTLVAIPAFDFPLSLTIVNQATGRSYGHARIADDFDTITSEGALTGVSPVSGSVGGGTEITISGYGFHEALIDTHVYIGNVPCRVGPITLTSIVCVTGPAYAEGTNIIQVISTQSVSFPGLVEFEFSRNSTPTVTKVVPTKGQSGDEVVMTGSLFGESPSNETVSVKIGGARCAVVPAQSNNTMLTCILGNNFVRNYTIDVVVKPFGRAQTVGVHFLYDLVIDQVVPNESSFAGMNTMRIHGIGFNPSDTEVSICEQPCRHTLTTRTLTEIECIVPSASEQFGGGGDLSCDMVVTTMGVEQVLQDAYTYRNSLTPRVTGISRDRGGTAGGTLLTIYGVGFSNNASVTIGHSECAVMTNQTSYSVSCVTGASSRTQRAVVQVFIAGMGFAISTYEFWYIDVWSSPFTWGGGPLPQAGDFVVIKAGLTVLLDTETPVLSFLLIRGGLIFDDEAGHDVVALHSEGVLITSGGRLIVGTEENPFLYRTLIVIYGHPLSTELPIYGAKTIAVREGTIEMHGKPINVTWTCLSETSLAGTSELHVRDYVTWESGSKIVIASTSYSQRENEELMIDYVEEGNIIHIVESLAFDHISEQQTIAGRLIDTCAEVGLLTRNIVVRGNMDETWQSEVVGCADEFRPGQFEVQTCFEGRFGNETTSNQFGVQIILHAPRKNEGLAVGKFKYIEVTNAGQAFRLGRYPIHFHINGNVSGSYVIGCAIHHTFNRAVTVHGVDYLLVERNVAFDVLGHAYFLEDGNEQFNTIRYNLAVFVRASSSLLNVDITPAAFWVVNPNNYVYGNAAAGGTHFGFWYRIPENPTGPSFNENMCPRKLPVAKFSDNTAHSFGWYGLWVFRHYSPSPTGACGDNDHAPAYFDRFTSWRNDRGVEFGEVGSLQLRDSVILDNKLAGVEVIEVNSVWGEKGAKISDSLIVGYSNISENCTKAGIKTPHSYYLTVSNVTLANFDREGCYPIQACSQCKDLEGGFETRYSDITLTNIGPSLTRWKWEHEHLHYGLIHSQDGEPYSLLPTSNLLDTDACMHHPESSDGSVEGSKCNGDVKFGRLAIFSPQPSSLETTDITLRNRYGEATLEYAFMRLRGGPGYMAVVPLNTSYELTWLHGLSFTNISYNIIVSGFAKEDYIIISQTYPRPLDVISIGGVSIERNVSVLDPASANTGDFAVFDDTTIEYIVKGDYSERTLAFSTYRCFFEDCIPPPPPTPRPLTPLGRPENGTLLWSNASSWPDNQVPSEGQNVTINGSVYVILDVPTICLDRLEILDGATLEVSNDTDHVIKASLILIIGGRLVAGYPEEPFAYKLTIELSGDVSTPEYSLDPFTTTVGAKAIGVFGELILNAAIEPDWIPWTLLFETAFSGDTFIELVDSVNWLPGQSIVITSTSYDAYETEVFEISSISNDGLVLELDGVIQYTHMAVQGTHYSIRAEVGLLSRDIVITNANANSSDAEAFGCRVLVSTYYVYYGSALLNGVEFKGCGQLGYVEDYDPRFALAMVRLRDGVQPSHVRDCSFHDGYNTAVGLFGTNDIDLDRNVIHSTVGPSMIVTGKGHSVTGNLASLSQYIGTYRGRDDLIDSNWLANYELIDAVNINFTSNHAAGGDKACVHVHGEECSDTVTSIIRDNVLHSALHGIHLGYSDRRESQCSRFQAFKVYSCQRYGIFSYSPSSIEVLNSTFISNWVGVYVTVIGPRARAHVVGNKHVRIENSVIVSAISSSRCTDELSIPSIASHQASHSGVQTPSGGHVGVLIPSYVSGPGHFPSFPWDTIISYPAVIAGCSTIRNVTFVNFEDNCGHIDAVLMTHRRSEDANLPVCLEQIRYLSDSGEPTNGNLTIFTHTPNVRRVNPSDCVDMDCDGHKQVVVKDLDGSFTGAGSQRTIISRAEFEWDGDPRRGLGDYRIPRAMLTDPNDGTRLDPNKLYPQKGIVRGRQFGDESDCSFNKSWNMYLCSELDHTMLVLESLDADTETRRLSPVGLAANGFINLLNGPMDNGWCGGYTCQERISTSFGIVASGFQYTIAFTSTNPQNLALHLLDSDEEDEDGGIVACIIYTSPQRLDVYVTDESGVDRFIVPKSATLLPNRNLEYAEPDMSLPDDQFVPTPQDDHGANHYNRTTKKLCIRIRGTRTVKIITTPRIVLSFNLTVTEEGFFEESALVMNIALLLGIPEEKIKVVDVVEETGSRRRKKRSSGLLLRIVIEISDNPIDDGGEDDESDDSTSSEDVLSFDSLLGLSEDLAIIVQSQIDLLLEGMPGVEVVGVVLIKPTAPPVDVNNGTLATPETGGPQPGDNGTEYILTYYEVQLLNEEEEANVSSPDGLALSLPSELVIRQILSGAIEGVPFSSERAPVVVMLDINGDLAITLGLSIPWVLTAYLSEGPDEAFITHASANFSGGRAVFEDLVFSHPEDYMLYFRITYPHEASFSIESSTVIEVERRDLTLNIIQQPQDGGNIFELDPYPIVELVDPSNGNLRVTDHSWRGTDWYVVAYIEGDSDYLDCVQLVSGVGIFVDIRISLPGEYRLAFEVFESDCDGEDLFFSSPLSGVFEIIELLYTGLIYTYNNLDYQSVIGNNRVEFEELFESEFQEEYPDLEVFDLISSDGSIIVSFFVTSEDEEYLITTIREITEDDAASPLSFTFRGTLFIPSSVVQDPDFPPTSLHRRSLVIVLSIVLPALFLTGVAVSVVVAYFCYKKHHSYEVDTILVEPNPDSYEMRPSSLPSYRSRPGTGTRIDQTGTMSPAPPYYEGRAFSPGAGSLTKVPLVFYSNPDTIDEQDFSIPHVDDEESDVGDADRDEDRPESGRSSRLAWTTHTLLSTADYPTQGDRRTH